MADDFGEASGYSSLKLELEQAEQYMTLKSRGPFLQAANETRDPFKNLLAGRNPTETEARNTVQPKVDDLVLHGITKNKGVYIALIGTPQSFPMFAKVGDKFADGYILSISETQVVLRKTHEGGVPLMRPRDIIKEIEEHDFLPAESAF